MLKYVLKNTLNCADIKFFRQFIVPIPGCSDKPLFRVILYITVMSMKSYRMLQMG
jgi:hypothetical protein